VKPNGIASGTYEARLSDDGSTLEKGKWSEAGTGAWTAKRTRKKPARLGERGFLERIYTGPKGGKFKYVVFVPHDFKKEDKKYPVILFLHASGESGKDGWAQTKIGVGPWIQKEFRGDPQRQYLTGWSLGGLASWRLAADHPKRWAALVPVCSGAGAPDTALAPKIKNIPCWCFHGAQDEAAPSRILEP
jgi:predicted peptidase